MGRGEKSLSFLFIEVIFWRSKGVSSLFAGR